MYADHGFFGAGREYPEKPESIRENVVRAAVGSTGFILLLRAIFDNYAQFESVFQQGRFVSPSDITDWSYLGIGLAALMVSTINKKRGGISQSSKAA